MAGKGRPNKYKSNVEPYLEDIKKWTLTMTEEQIAETLDVSYSSFRTYKQQYPALIDALKKGRKDLVAELKSTLIMKAKGFDYTETKVTKELCGEYDDLVVTKVEETTKRAQPDVAAINLLLKNYDKENWANDPQMIELKKKELELREKQAEEGDWS